jgi:hypothetical protein
MCLRTRGGRPRRCCARQAAASRSGRPCRRAGGSTWCGRVTSSGAGTRAPTRPPRRRAGRRTR